MYDRVYNPITGRYQGKKTATEISETKKDLTARQERFTKSTNTELTKVNNQIEKDMQGMTSKQKLAYQASSALGGMAVDAVPALLLPGAGLAGVAGKAVSTAGEKVIASAGEKAISKIGTKVVGTGIKKAGKLIASGGDAYLTTMGVSAWGTGYDQAVKAGATEDEALNYATGNAAIQVLFEKLSSVGSVFKRLAGTGMIDAESLVNKGINSLLKDKQMGNLAQFLVRSGTAATVEGAEELLAGIAEPILRKATYQKEPLDWKSEIASAWEQFQVGAVLGGVLGGPGAAVNIKQTNAVGDMYSDPETISALIDTGLNSSENTRAYKLAESAATQIKGGITPSRRQLVNLAVANQETIQEEQAQEEQAKAITNRTIERTVGKEYIKPASNIEEELQYHKTAREVDAGIDMPATVQEYGKIKDSVSKIMAEEIQSGRESENGAESDVASISKILIGEGTSSDFVKLNPGNDTARAVFEKETGKTLPTTNAETKNFLLNYNENMRVVAANIEKQPSSLYVRDNARTAFMRAGKMGLPMETVTEKYGTVLTEQEQKAAYESGKNTVVKEEVKAKTQQPKKNRSTEPSRSEIGLVDKSSNPTKSEKNMILDNAAKVLGVSVELRDDIITDDGKVANGYYYNGTIVLSKNSTNPLATVLDHEAGHYLKEKSPEEYDKLLQFVKREMFSNDPVKFNNEIKRLEKLYGKHDDDYFIEEIISDNLPEIFSSPELGQKLATENPTLAQKLLDFIKKFIDSMKALHEGISTGKFFEELGIKEEVVNMMADIIKKSKESTATTEETEPKYSISKNLKSDLNKVLNNKMGENEEIYIGMTSNFLSEKLEMEALVMTMPASKAYANMVTKEQAIKEGRYRKSDDVNYHGLTADGLTKALIASEKPIAAFSSSPETKSKRMNRIVMVTDVLDSNGDNVVVVEKVSTKGIFNNKFTPVNKIITSYGKTLIGNMINDAISENRIMYVDKEKISNLSVIPDLQLVNNVNDAYLTTNIDHFWENVNYEKTKPKEKPFEPATQTLEEAFKKAQEKATIAPDDAKKSLQDSEGNKLTPAQAEFFKDSKIRDEQGRLLKVYHGTPDGGFTVFNAKQSIISTTQNATNWFSTNKNMVNKYYNVKNSYSLNGNQLFEIYLNITNPFVIDANNAPWNQIKIPNSLLGNFEKYYNPNTRKMVGKTHVSTDELSVYAKQNNFDGIVIKNVIDGSAKESFVADIYGAFFPNQIKSVDNQNPTEDDDIRYQLQEQHDIDKLRARNKIDELKTLLAQEKLSEQGKLPNQLAMSKLVKQLRADYNSQISINKPGGLVDQLTQIYVLLKSKGDNLEAVYEKSHNLAKDIISQGGEMQNETEKEYKALKEYMRTTPILIEDQYKGDFGRGDFNKFRKSMFGRLKLSKDGKTMDSIYPEMLELFPELLNKEVTHPTDQLMHVLDVMEELKPVFDTYDIGSEAGTEMVDMVTLDILDAMFGMDPQQPMTANARRAKYQNILESIEKSTNEYVDKTEQQKAADKAKYQKMLSEIEVSEANRRIEQKKAYERLVAELKSERDEQIKLTKLIGEAKLKKREEVFRKRLENTKARFYENRSRGEMMDSIKRNADFLAEALVNPTDTKHIPEGYKKAVAEMLSGLDFESTHTDAWEKRMGSPGKRVVRLRKLAQQYESILDGKEEAFTEFDEDMRPLIRNLSDTLDGEEGGKRLSELNNGELNNVRVILQHLRHVISTANKTFNENIKESISGLGENIISQMSSPKTKKEYAGILGSMGQFFNEQTVAPTDFFAITGGTLEKMYYQVRKGFDKHINNVTDAMSYIDKSMEGYNKKDVKSWAEGFGKTQTFTLSNGKEIQLLPAQVMSLYALNKREQARGHILGSGIVVAPLSVKEKGLKEKLAKTHRMVTPEDIGMILSSLTEEQKSLTNKLLRFISTTTSEWGNETSMKLYGIRKFTETNYFPIKSDKAFLMEQFEVKGDAKIKNLGFTKGTVEMANNPIVLDDFFNVITNHITQMSMYNAMVPPLTDFERVYNYTQRMGSIQTNSVKNAIQNVMGQKGNAYISRLMQNINGSYNKEYGIEWAEKLLSGFKKSALGLNMRVLVQQPTSLIRSSMVIDHTYLLEGMAQKISGKATRKEMWDHVPIARWKSWGYAQTDVSREQKDIMMGNTNALDTITMGSYGFADDVSWTILYGAVKAETKDKFKDLEYDTPEYWEHIVDRFNEVVDRTQVVDSVFHRTEIMRDKTFFKKTLTSFMPEPLKLYNMIRTQVILANRESQNGNTANAALMYGRMAASLVPYFAVLTVVQSLMDTIRRSWTGGDDDDDKSYLELFQENFWSNLIDNVNPMNMLPFFRDVWSNLKGYDVKRPDLAILTNMSDDVKRLIAYFDPDKESSYSMVYICRKLVEDLVAFKGVPLKNATRELESATYAAMAAMGYTQASIYFKNKMKYKVLAKKNDFIDLYLKAEMLGDPQDASLIYDDLKKEGITEADITKRIKYTYGKEFRTALSEGELSEAKDEIDKMVSLGVSRKELVNSVQNSVAKVYKQAFENGDTESLDKYDSILEKVGYTDADLLNYRYGYAKNYAKYQVYTTWLSDGESAAYAEASKWVSEYPGMYDDAEDLIFGIERSADSTLNMWASGKWQKEDFDKFE